MATVDTASPTVSTRDHRPPIGDGINIAGELDLSEASTWSFLSSFAFSTPDHFEFSYDSSVPDVDISAGRIARQTDSGQKMQTVQSVTGLGLAASEKNYIYWSGNNEMVSRDADSPPANNSLLIGTINTSNDRVNTDTRGRSPISQFVTDKAKASVTEAPNGHLPNTDLANGDFADLLVTLADGETITVKRWEGKTNLGSAPSGLTVQLVDSGGTVVKSENTLRTINTTGITSYTNNSGGLETVRLRLDNSTGSQLDAAAVFGYEVV